MADLTQYLKNHPRMIGALFTILLILAKAGTVSAGNTGSFVGP